VLTGCNSLLCIAAAVMHHCCACTCSLIQAYSQGGQWQAAVETLHTMRTQGIEPDAFSYSSAMNACEKCHKVDEAMLLYEDMKAHSVKGSDYVFSSLIRCASHAG
jgi:pentatricopeptide repeat protein